MHEVGTSSTDSVPGLCPDDLRIIPQCSMPFEKGSRMGLRKLPVTVRVDGDDVFDTAPDP